MVIYVSVTGVILERSAAAAESGWEKCGYVSIWGRGHGGADMRGGEVTASGRCGWGGSVQTFAVVATVCTPIGGW